MIKPKVAVIFRKFGPYHLARLYAASKLLDITAIEISSLDQTYDWLSVDTHENLEKVTLFTDNADTKGPKEIIRHTIKALDQKNPDAVAIPGWDEAVAIAAMIWCRKTSKPSIVMADSTFDDRPRKPWQEKLKSRILQQNSAALVAGSATRHYVETLGMPHKNILEGYDIVDNKHFSVNANRARIHQNRLRKTLRLPQNYFLACSRFVPKKNLHRLIQAFANYVKQSKEPVWSLVIVGDGPLKKELVDLTCSLNMSRWVIFPGFKQYDDLPVYYGLARVFFHASMVEQWGLVVNEAMACGLPVMVSKKCGCAADLVQNEINGFSFDPFDIENLTRLMIDLSSGKFDLVAMGRQSQNIISKWDPDLFAINLLKSSKIALAERKKNSTVFDCMLLYLLIFRTAFNSQTRRDLA